MKQIEKLLKDLEKFSNESKDPSFNSANKNFKQETSSPFYFSTDFHFEKSISYIENLPKIKSDKIRVGLLLGESYFLSFLPELRKHVDIVILVDIEDRVLMNAEFLYTLMKESITCNDFALKYSSDENIMLKKEWGIVGTEVENNKKHKLKIDKKTALSLLLANNQMLGNKHFIETDQRYLQCRSSLLDLNFAFVKLDLLDPSSISQFKAILDKHNSMITIANVNNLLDYDANYAVRDAQNQKKDWSPTGKLYSTLLMLTKGQEISPRILFSRLNKDEGYKSLTSCQANSIYDYIKLTQAYAQEINKVTFKRQSKAISQFGAVYKNITTTNFSDVNEVESLRLKL